MKRAGIYVDNLNGEAMYQSFKPNPLPPIPEIEMDGEIVKLLVDANKQLVKLDTASQLISNADLFISMYVRKEALISSQIEGTQCTLDDVLDPEVEANANLDVSDVINYVKATQYALKRLERLPLCCRLIREIHEVLMENVRGQDKTPGEFRHSQNWIGPANCSLKDARYIPPNVEDMQTAMSDLEKYINENVDYDPLIRAALIHYQFETIHPFLNGNGRIGRLLILLYLMEQKLIEKPVIYISYFLKKNQIEYYDRISEVRRTGNFEQWIRFFLEAVSKAASDSLEAIRQLSVLHDTNVEKLPKTTRSKDNLRAVFDYIEQYPIIDIKRTAKELEVSYNTVAAAVRKLVELGILQETTNAARNRVFAYEEYLAILRKDT
ncbi:MAG: Fic family protein [Lachnospiraceae bacterium]|uniref:Fic family protein n=1 Tax=Maccoyibacter intestinihominis TaxID=3133499 RepID=A0ABV1HA80_9FIRM|nr:Fic family protein [Lachnospiraceae bacterium]HBH99136.1 Fic family protein [Lachnospiraceae bacterium]